MRTHTLSLYVAATRRNVWHALTDGAMTRRFYYGLSVESDWLPGSPLSYRAESDGAVPMRLTGEIVHIEPEYRLVHSLLTDTEPMSDIQSWISWEIHELEPGTCRVTLTRDDVDRYADSEHDEAWGRLLSGLKTVAESGVSREW